VHRPPKSVYNLIDFVIVKYVANYGVGRMRSLLVAILQSRCECFCTTVDALHGDNGVGRMTD